MKTSFRWLIATASAFTLAYCILLAIDLVPQIRGPEQWRWAYGRPGTYHRLWLPALLLLLHALFAQFQLTRRGRTRLLLLWCLLITPAIQLALLYMDHPDVRSQLFYRVVSPLASGYFTVGTAASDTYHFLNAFSANMPSFPIHPQRHPPGLMLIFLWTRQLFEQAPPLANWVGGVVRPYQCHNLDLMYLPNTVLASALVQMLQPIWSGLLSIPLFVFARRFGNLPTARIAVLLWPLLPGVALWATSWNIIYSVFTMGVLLTLHRGLSQGHLASFAYAGVLLSLSLFFSIGNLVLIGFVGLMALVWLIQNWQERPTWQQIGRFALIGSAATTSVWLLAWLYARIVFWDVLDIAMTRHLGLAYDYWLWVFYHPYDFLIFLGIPLAVLWLAATIHTLRNGKDGNPAYQLLVIAFVALLLLMIFSGTSQGEVARVWAFLYPVPLAIAAYKLTNHNRATLLVIGLLSMQVFVGNIYLRLHDSGFSDPPLAPPPAMINTEGLATWQNGIGLRSTEARFEHDQRLVVQSVWAANHYVDRPYTQFLHLVAADGTLVAQQDGMPLDGQWATTCWVPAQSFAETRTIALDAPLPPGAYDLMVGWYYLPTGQRDLLIDTLNTAYTIEQITIE